MIFSRIEFSLSLVDVRSHQGIRRNQDHGLYNDLVTRSLANHMVPFHRPQDEVCNS